MVAAAIPRTWTLLLLCLVAWRALADNLALLSETLRTFQQTGCYDQLVSLRCPHGTSISVQMAQYSRHPPAKPPCLPAGANTTCDWPGALQVVVEACQKKRQCKFQSTPGNVGVDPCPGVRKFLHISYKCRPYEFRRKMVCEDDVVQLECNPNSRLVVYSASFGRTEYESMQCPQAPGAPEETCLVSYATETVMDACHGKRRCTIKADATTFGDPCRPQTRMYLKAVYTCVPRKVLKENIESELDEDELVAAATGDAAREDDDDFDYDKGEFFRESAFISPSPNQEKAPGGGAGGGGTELDPARGGGEVAGEEAPGAGDRTPGALDHLHVYLGMAAAATLLVLTGLVLGRLLAQRRAAAGAAPQGHVPPHLAVAETALDVPGVDGGGAKSAAVAAALHRWQQTDVDLAGPVVVVAPLGLDRGDGGAPQFFGR